MLNIFRKKNSTSDAGPEAVRNDFQIQPKEFAAIAVNAMDEEFRRLIGWRAGAGVQYGGLRDITKVCGYSENLTWDDYWTTYDRFELAGRVVEAYPDATFMAPPKIIEREIGNDTPFEREIREIMQGQPNALGYLNRLDIVAGIGQFGLLYIGLDDRKDPKFPIDVARKNRILYMRPIKQGDVTITQWGTNPREARYGKPLEYKVVLTTPQQNQNSTASGAVEQREVHIHYSRVIHFADNLLDNDTFGTSRIHRVFNRLSDTIKIVAGSAEMFWRGAYQGIAFEMDAEAQVDDTARDAMKEDIEKYLSGLSRQLLLQGTKAKPMAPNVSSPADHFDIVMSMIAIAAKIPKRILLGSEQGKLASSQDLRTWNRNVLVRRNNTAEPRLVRELVRFCIDNNVVSKPTEGTYHIIWPDMSLPDEGEKAKISALYTDALTSYIAGQIYYLMKFDIYLQKVWGMSQEDATSLAEGIDYKKLESVGGGAAKKTTRDFHDEYETETASSPKGADE